MLIPLLRNSNTVLGRNLKDSVLYLSAVFENIYIVGRRGVVSSGMAGSSTIAIPQIDSWIQYYEKNKERLRQQSANSTVKCDPDVKFKVNNDLNNKIAIWKGDITKLGIDAIVNAANSSLMGGGGVDGAIHRTAGPDLKQECKGLGGCNVGDAKITKGYKLPSKYVIHTVGPQGEKPVLLKSCYDTCLSVLVKNKLRTVAFPCISTGVYGYPQNAAANVALKSVRQFLEAQGHDVDRIIFCLFLEDDVKIYENLLQSYFPIE